MCSFIELFVLILVTIYVAFMYESSAVMLFVYVEVAFMLASFTYLMYRMYTLKGAISVPISISEIGKENLVKVNIINNSRIPIMRMKANVMVKDTLGGHSKKCWMKLQEVNTGENEYIRSLILPSAGNYEVSIRKLRIYDFTGLLYINMKVRSTDRVQVMPKLYDVPVRLTMAIKNFYGEADVYDENTPGHDKSELFQIREYQKGDRLQSVHWKMTAKQDAIMVKEHSLPKSCPVILFMDFTPNNRLKSKAICYFEAALSISYSIMDAGCPHYIVWYDSAEKDVKRLRVDDEESLFFAMTMLMKIKWEKTEEDIELRYNEKFRHEPYLHALKINEKLELKKAGEIYATLSENNIEKSLSDIELLL